MLRKIFLQSLSGDNGQFSSKKLTMGAYSALGIFMVLCDMWHNSGELNYEAFLIVISMSAGQTLFSIADKKINDLPAHQEPGPDKTIITQKTEIIAETTEK